MAELSLTGRLHRVRERAAESLAHAASPQFRPAWTVLVVGILATLAVYRLSNAAVELDASARFKDLAARVVSRLEQRMAANEQILRGVTALLQISPGTSRQRFAAFVNAFDLEKNFPAIQGVGYSVFVKPEDLDAHIAAVRAEGFPNYKVMPEGDRPIYSTILFLEPFDWRNRRAFGYDMYSEPIRRRAMEWARDTGLPSLSGRVVLRQETNEDVQSGFLLYQPLYAEGMPLNTVDERRSAIRGYVYAPFRAGRLFQQILATESQAVRTGLELSIYDQGKVEKSDLLFSTQPAGVPARASRYRSRVDHEIYGRTWLLDMASTSDFEQSISFTGPRVALLSGTLISALLALFIASMATRQMQLARANEHMSLLTRELSHRVKNTLAVVQAIASRSLSDGRTITEARNVFMKRLHALARAHTLLLETSWSGASLRTLAAQELEPFGVRATIKGPEIALSAGAAQSFALVLHELATNAIKYGAMSQRSGRIDVEWRIDRVRGKEPSFVFRWQEHGGPVVHEPTHRGFGRTLLSQQIGHGGERPKISYNSGGLSYEVSAPLASVTDASLVDSELGDDAD